MKLYCGLRHCWRWRRPLIRSRFDSARTDCARSTSSPGAAVSAALKPRRAITEIAARERRHAGLAAEARRLMEDRTYVNEAREVAALMEELRGPR